jgi:ribonuclease I
MYLQILLSTYLLSFVTSSYEEGALAGTYDNYVFAMEWQPQWSQPPYCTDELASHMTPESYASIHWSLHGLWPNYNTSLHDGKTWPQYCLRDDGEDYTVCDGNFDAEEYCYPKEAINEYNNTNDWQKYALEYAWSDLATHEWSKHGSCTLWDSEDYFYVSQKLFQTLSYGNGAMFVTSNIGNYVSKTDLLNEFKKDTNGKNVTFNCDSECNLSEIWSRWDMDSETYYPTTAMDYGDSDACSYSCDYFMILNWTNDGTCPTDTCIYYFVF